MRETETPTPQHISEQASFEVGRTEKELNEIVPVLAHGLVRRLEQKGLRGKVRVQAMAGDEWGVGTSPENPAKDVPNIIVYPREYLIEDKKLVNAKLRHEIGNLNYPIEAELNNVNRWCQKNRVAPELLTSLAETIHEASVNYLEIQNSHSAHPEQNFQALYEEEVDTQRIAREISEQAPYKQALDLTLLHTLSYANLVPPERVEEALQNAHPEVQQVFDQQTRSLLNQAVKTAVPARQVELVKNYVWPRFSRLVSVPIPVLAEMAESTEAQPQPQTQMPEGATAGEQAQPEQKGEAGSQLSEQGELQQSMQHLQEEFGQMKDMLEQLQEQLKESGKQDPSVAQQSQEALQQIQEALEQMQQQAQEAGFSPEKEEAIQDLQEQLAQMQQKEKQGESADSLMQEMQEIFEKMQGVAQKVQQEGEQLDQTQEQAQEAEAAGQPTTAGDQLQNLQEQLQELQQQTEAGQSGTAGQEGISEAMQQATQEMMNQVQNLMEQISQISQVGETPTAAEQMQNQLEKLMEMLGQMQEQLKQGEKTEQADQMNEQMQSMLEAIEQMMKAAKQPPTPQPHETFQSGGKSSGREFEELFEKPDPKLLQQLRKMEAMVGSKFATRDEQGNFATKSLSAQAQEQLQERKTQATQRTQAQQLETLEQVKREQRAKLEKIYREMSGLEGEALRIYIDYMESTRDFSKDLTEFFVEKFELDREYVYAKRQSRGARLQRGYQQNILGTKEEKPRIHPRSFERKYPPEKPQLIWTLIIDNSGSCSGEIIEEEKRLAVALIEVAKTLDIPFEIVTFGGQKEYTFLKTFEQDVIEEDLQKIVLLNADQGTPDVVTLDAACASMQRFADRFNRSYNFVYFLTDGQSGGGSIREVVEKYKRDMVITGIGLANAARTIAQTWGKNALEVPEVKRLSDKFIHKIEDQIDETFD